MIEFLDRVAPLMDTEMTTALRKQLEKQGIKFKFKTTAESAKVENGKVKLSWRSGEETGVEDCDKVLVSVGRRPYTESLGLREIGVEMDPRRLCQSERTFRDKCSRHLRDRRCHRRSDARDKAEDEGIAAVEQMAGVAGHVNYLCIPNVIYTHPELASVGYSEEDAKAKGIEYKVGKFPFAANGRAKAMDDSDGMVKILADAKTDRLIGMHILGPRQRPDRRRRHRHGTHEQRRRHRPIEPRRIRHCPKPCAKPPWQSIKEQYISLATDEQIEHR